MVRGESRAIAESYKEGFEALCYYAELRRAKQNRHCSLLLAKKDGRLWYLLKGSAKFGIPEELREDIVGLAFFGTGPKTGKGRRVYPHGRWTKGQVNEGEFKDGEPHGYGKMVVIGDEGEYKCEGEYKEGFPHGQATVMFPNGDVYQGELGPRGIGKGTYTKYNGEDKCIWDTKRSARLGIVRISSPIMVRGSSGAQTGLIVRDKSGSPVELRPDSGVDGGW